MVSPSCLRKKKDCVARKDPRRYDGTESTLCSGLLLGEDCFGKACVFERVLNMVYQNME
jgi:hypothetical protein